RPRVAGPSGTSSPRGSGPARGGGGPLPTKGNGGCSAGAIRRWGPRPSDLLDSPAADPGAPGRRSRCLQGPAGATARRPARPGASLRPPVGSTGGFDHGADEEVVDPSSP